MRLYSDVFSDEEVISDSYPVKEKYGGVVWEIKANFIIKKEGEIDIGCGNAFGGGGEDEQVDNEAEKVLDIVDTFNYGETSFDKANFVIYFKNYMKKVLDYLKKNKPDRVEPFMAGAKQLFAWAKQNFDDISFYCPKNYDIENHLVMSYYQGEDVSPTFIYIMDGLKFIKV